MDLCMFPMRYLEQGLTKKFPNYFGTGIDLIGCVKITIDIIKY